MKTQTALEVAEKCLEYCLTFGIPESVLTDQGTNFTSQVIESLWERLDVHTLRTTAYHPQTDGITERFNRTIKTMLTQFVHEQKQDDWDQKLNKLSFAYNTAVHAVTKFSPFELMFGRIPKLPIDLVYDQTDADELKAKIEVEWIASDFVDQQRKEMKAMFDFAAANRDAASLRASTLYDRSVRGANFKVGDKVWVLDQGTKVGTNPKLRPRWKGPYLVTDMFNEVNAILKADGRSRKTKIVHLCKLKRCFGKPPVVTINNEEQSVNESSQISNSFDPMSPAPNRKGEEGRMACPNARANASNNELTVGQPLDLVPELERDDHSMEVDSQDNDFPVNKLPSKGHRTNKEDVRPSTSKATRSTQSPKNRPILKNLKRAATQKQQSRLEEIIEEDLSIRQDEYMPHTNSPTSNRVLMISHPACHSGKGPKTKSKTYEESTHSTASDSDEAVTPKTPIASKIKDLIPSDRSTDEEIIKSDEESNLSDERDSPLYTSASSDDNEGIQNNAPVKGGKERSLSQSLTMDESQIQRALQTFSAS